MNTVGAASTVHLGEVSVLIEVTQKQITKLNLHVCTMIHVMIRAVK